MNEVGLELLNGCIERSNIFESVEVVLRSSAVPGEESIDWCSGVFMGTESDRVSARSKFDDEGVNDALDPTVQSRWNGEFRIGGEENSHF